MKKKTGTSEGTLFKKKKTLTKCAFTPHYIMGRSGLAGSVARHREKKIYGTQTI